MVNAGGARVPSRISVLAPVAGRGDVVAFEAVLSELANIDQGGDKASLLLEKLGREVLGFVALPIDVAQLGQPGFERLGELNEQFEQSF